MTAAEIVRWLLICISLAVIAVLSWLWWREGRPVLAGRGEDVSAVDGGEAYCTDPVDEHADETFAVLDEHAEREHFALWEQQMGADR